MNIEPTGFCWNCGLICKELFCNDKCKRLYENRQARDERKHNHLSKKEGYGLLGSTH